MRSIFGRPKTKPSNAVASKKAPGSRLELLEGALQDVQGQRRQHVLFRDSVREGLLPADNYGSRVWRRDLLDQTQAAESRYAELWRGVHPPGEDEILCDQGLAVVPAQAGLESIGRLHCPIREDAPGPGAQVGDCLRQERLGQAALVEVDELGVQQDLDILGPFRSGEATGQDLLAGEACGFPGGHDHQRAVDRRRSLLVLAAERPAGGTGRRDQREEHRGDDRCGSLLPHSKPFPE
jgi:hypothetical protein